MLDEYGATTQKNTRRTQKAQKLRRRRKRNTKLFKNALKQCLCGLQGINGWEGAWGLVVVVFAALLGLDGCGDERRGRGGLAEDAEEMRGANAKGAEVTQKAQKGIPKFVWKRKG